MFALMKAYRTLAVAAALSVLVGLPLAAQWPATEKLDLDAIYRIKDEGLQRSKVMEIESYLTDVYGPRLTGSPEIKEAAEWSTSTSKHGRSDAAGRIGGWLPPRLPRALSADR